MTISISLFVDDERPLPCPTWTLARTVAQAMRYFEDDSPYHIEQLSLDWHMGDRMPDGIFIANEIVSRVDLLELSCLKDTQTISLHSSDRDMARRQSLIFEKAKERGLLNRRCRILINTNVRNRPKPHRG